MRRVAFALCALAVVASAPAADEARLLRFPAIHGEQIVFTYAGDLYTVPTAGGTARRLTSHPGFEMFPRFSPDGKTVAFTAQYDGNTEVFVVPAEGGEPKRLTYTATLGRDDVSDRMGPNNIVMGWTPDGKNVLFRSRMRSFNDFIGQLFTVPVEGGLAEELPLPRGGFASYSADGKQLAFNRIFREFRTWKRYRGGMADDVWLYDFATKKTEQLTDDPAQDIIPMMVGGRVYFLSDRGKEMRFNLYSVDPQTKKVERHTEFTEFDCKFPSSDETSIVFENGGFIYKFDVKGGKAEKVKVVIAEDRVGARGGLTDVSKDVTAAVPSPDGKRVLFGARGNCSLCRPVRVLPATSPAPQAFTTATRSGRRTARTWHSFRTRPARTKSTSARPTAAPRRRPSPPAATRTSSRSAGRPTRRRSCGATRSCGSSSWTWRRGR
jgi:tricorn protease